MFARILVYLTLVWNCCTSEEVKIMREGNRFFVSAKGQDIPMRLDVGPELAKLQEKFITYEDSNEANASGKNLEKRMTSPMETQNFESKDDYVIDEAENISERGKGADPYKVAGREEDEEYEPTRVDIIRRCIQSDSNGQDPPDTIIRAVLYSIEKDIDEYLKKRFSHLEL